MAEQLQSLLDKIQNDGVKKAEERAAAILAEAEAKAKTITEKAEADAAAVRAQAERDRQALEQRGESAVRQAARDVVLALGEELKRRLSRIVEADMEAAMTPEFTAGVIAKLLESAKADPNGAAALQLMLPPDMLEQVTRCLTSSLGADFRKEGRIFPLNGSAAGFQISFGDNGVFYDFSAETLTSLIANYAGSRIAAVLKTDAQ